MSFLAPAVLWASALIAVPVVIHLLNRRRFRTVEWAPMTYLRQAFRKHRRRLRLEEILLLIIRTAFVAGVVLALARPLTKTPGWPWGGLEARTARVLVLDDTLSMGYRAGAATAFDVQRRAAELLLDAWPVEDGLTIVTATAPERALFSAAPLRDRDPARAALRAVELTDASCSISGVLAAARKHLDASPWPLREVVIVTDLRKPGWDDAAAASEALAATGAKLRIVDAGADATDDVAITSLRAPERVVFPGQTVELVATIRNGAAERFGPAMATLRTNGGERTLAVPKIEPGEEARVPFTVTFDKAGTHPVSLRLPDDALPADGFRMEIVTVREGLDVVLVDGDPSPEPFSGEADYVATALSVGDFPVRVQLENDSEWLSKPPSRCDLAILCNVASMPPAHAIAVEALVRKGMGLIVFPGDHVDPEAWNDRLDRDGDGVLPGALAPPKDGLLTGIVIADREDSPFGPLRRLAPGALAAIRARRHLPLEIPPDAAEKSATHVLATWSGTSDAPAIVERASGEGRVVLWATTADRAWSDWVVDPSWLLAVREASFFAARRGPSSLEQEAGPDLVFKPGCRVAAARLRAPREDEDRSVEIREEKDELVLHCGAARIAGAYALSFAGETGAAEARTIAVNPVAAEAALARWDRTSLRKSLGRLETQILGASELEANDLGRSHELWRNLIVAAIVFFLLEGLLTAHLGKEGSDLRHLLELLLGVDLSGAEGDTTPRIEWARLPARGDQAILWIVASLAIAAGIVWLYRRDARGAGKSGRRLIALRLGVLAVLVAVIAEPVLVLEHVDQRKTRLLVLSDASESMDLADRDLDEGRARRIAEALKLGGPDDARALPRRDLVERTLGAGLLEALAADGDRDVVVHPFADRLFERPSDLDAAGARARRATAIGAAIAQATSTAAGGPLAGVLVISDGQSNSGPDPVRAAKAAAAARVPVSVIAVGTPRGGRNVRLASLDAGPIVFARDHVEIAALVEAEGFEAETVKVVLEARQGADKWEEIGRQEIALGPGELSRKAVFPWKRDEPGELEMRATIEPVPGEALPDDNSAAAKVRVVRPELRVLLVAGHAFPEVQFLIHTLIRDPGIVATTWLQGAEEGYPQKGEQKITRLPETEAEIDVYDAVVLYDPDPAAWPPEFPALLRHLVGEKAGGVVYVCGETFTRALFDRDTPGSETLLDLLPIIREPHLYVSPVEERLHSRDAWRLDITEAGMAGGLFRFHEDPAEGERIGRGLPGLYWHFPVTREKPGAIVLARHGDPRMTNAHGRHVIVASQLFGPGHAVFLAGDSTYRWRYVSEQVFDGFWARVVDHAGRAKTLGGIDPLVVTTDLERYTPGSVVRVQARFRRSADRPADLVALAGRVEDHDGGLAPIELRRSPDQKDLFEATYEPSKAGLHHVTVWPSDSRQENAKPSSGQFTVAFDDRERARPGQDRAMLNAIAAAGGGRVFDLDQARQAAGAFALRRVPVVFQRRQELWDAPLLAAILFGCLFGEWVLRKRHGLV